jgi:hypothetical protein
VLFHRVELQIYIHIANVLCDVRLCENYFPWSTSNTRGPLFSKAKSRLEDKKDGSTERRRTDSERKKTTFVSGKIFRKQFFLAFTYMDVPSHCKSIHVGQKPAGLHFGRFFHKRIRSPWLFSYKILNQMSFFSPRVVDVTNGS